MEIPDIVFAPINSKIGFKAIYNLMLTEGLDFNTALDKCIQIIKISNHLNSYKCEC